MTEEGADLDRRTLIRLGALASFAGLAGCAGDGEGTPTATEPATDTPSETPGGPTTTSPSETDGQARHQIPHPDDATVPDAEASGETLGGIQRGDPPENKNGIGFQHEPEGEEWCGNCNQYVPDQDGDGFGACNIVSGKIHPCDWCQLYVPYTGEGVVPCEE